ncbi:MAG TPA: hypothetical protein VGL62_01545, partial [Vicinamibacterales bacterium]
ADAEDVVPPPVLIVSSKRGGILLGAFEPADRMVGFVYSLPGVKDGRLTQWSHMLGVAPSARQTGIGLALKLAQRERARALGIDLIEWTFDPLQAPNAHLNFSKLGIVVDEYDENLYGESSSPLHRGTPTDRFVAQWRLDAPHVLRRIAGGGLGLVRDAAVGGAPVVNPSRSEGRWLRPGPADLTARERRLLAEIPSNFTELQAADPAVALDWRVSTRAVFRHYLARGYRVVDFFLSAEAGRGQYLLALKE